MRKPVDWKDRESLRREHSSINTVFVYTNSFWPGTSLRDCARTLGRHKRDGPADAGRICADICCWHSRRLNPLQATCFRLYIQDMPIHTNDCGGGSSDRGASSRGRRRVEVRPVDECETLDEVFTHCLPAFGGAFLRRVYNILDRAIGSGCPLTIAVSGPVTVSGQHQAWLIPLLKTGWVAYLSTTDAVCYHDGHRSLDAFRDGPIHEVSISSDDGALREEGTIRVTDMAFDEGVLLDQDRFISACLSRPEFQKRMTGTEMRHLLGAFYGAQETKNGVSPGLLSTCQQMSIPVLVGAPADGSIFLNSMKLWAMQKAGLVEQYRFELDMHAEVFESCAYHRWGLFEHPARSLATLVLGGGCS